MKSNQNIEREKYTCAECTEMKVEEEQQPIALITT